MDKKKLKFGLVGCGRIAKRHADLLGGGQIHGASLAAVCDIKEERAKGMGSQYKVPYYCDMHEMLQQQPLDVISILTPSGMHAEHAIALAKYKKHLVVEKPMALTLEDADAMIQACDAAGIKLFIVKQNRYNYPVVKLKEALDSNRFGKIVMGTVRVRWCRTQEYYDSDKWRGTWYLDGGVFANQASHHVDLLQWLLGEPESVFAKARTALVNIEVEDTGVAIIKFRSGALGIVEATTATRPKDIEGSLSLLGAKGMVEIGGFAVNKIKIWDFAEPLAEDAIVLEKYSQNPPNVYGFGHLAYLEHVVDAVVNNKPSLVDGLEGRKSIELITAIYESIETGQEVFVGTVTRKCRLGRKQSGL